MKRTLLAIAASLGLAVGALGATSTAADARVSVHVGIGFYSGGYYPGYYPYYPRYAYPYRVYRYPYYAPPRHLACYTILQKRVYWRYYRKHVIFVPIRVCNYRYRY